MYPVLVALLAIVAYHNGIKNPDLDIAPGMVITAGRSSNSQEQSVPSPTIFRPTQMNSDEDDYRLNFHENI